MTTYGELDARKVLIGRPLTTIRDTLLRPRSEAQIPPEKLASLLKWHLTRLQTPWQPFGPPKGKQSLAGSITIPDSSANLGVMNAGRGLAEALSKRVHIDEVWSYLLFASYSLHSINEEDDTENYQERELERLTMWYTQEVLAVSQIAKTLLQEGEDGEWWDVIEATRGELMAEAGRYMEEVFRGWSGLAQKQAEGLFW